MKYLFSGNCEIFTKNLYLCFIELAKFAKVAYASMQLIYTSSIPQRLNFKMITQKIVSFSLNVSDKEKLMILLEGIL